MSEEIKIGSLSDGGNIFIDKNRLHISESAQWLRFAEAFVPTAQDCHAYGEHQEVANYAADFADAMVKEAKARGRL